MDASAFSEVDPESQEDVKKEDEDAKGSEAHPAQAAQKEAAKPNASKSPKDPTADEIAEHLIVHLPYRSWCDACVMGRKKTCPHNSHPDHECAVPEVSLDYCFLKDAVDNPA